MRRRSVTSPPRSAWLRGVEVRSRWGVRRRVFVWAPNGRRADGDIDGSPRWFNALAPPTHPARLCRNDDEAVAICCGFATLWRGSGPVADSVPGARARSGRTIGVGRVDRHGTTTTRTRTTRNATSYTNAHRHAQRPPPAHPHLTPRTAINNHQRHVPAPRASQHQAPPRDTAGACRPHAPAHTTRSPARHPSPPRPRRPPPAAPPQRSHPAPARHRSTPITLL